MITVHISLRGLTFVMIVVWSKFVLCFVCSFITRGMLVIVCTCEQKTVRNLNEIYIFDVITVELQWLKHLWDHEIMFETGVGRGSS